MVKSPGFELGSDNGSITVRSWKCCLISSLNFLHFKMVIITVPISECCEDKKHTKKS